MEADLISLAVIVAMAFLCPVISQSIPGKPIPETVFLLIAGTICGPHVLGIIGLSDAVNLLSDLGLGFLFLLAGYEINPSVLSGTEGKRGVVTWAATLALAFGVVFLLPDVSATHIDGLSVTIALTTTAIGTLLPILQERGILETRVGEEVLAYGTWGEIAPIIAMTLLLSTRAEWITVAVLFAFLVIAVICGVIPKIARKAGGYVFRFIERNADSNSQMLVRSVVLLLVVLTAVSAVFDLDIVLGAFAAGFIVRYVVPEGSELLEQKLDSIAFGFFIPLFFIVSGAKIDVTAITANPRLLLGFIGLLLLVRAVPVFIGLSTGRDSRTMSVRDRLAVASYCTTALPLIVAVTSVAVSANAMSQQTASVLVAAGGITVFLMPLLSQALMRTANADLGEAFRQIKADPHDAKDILREHRALERERHRQRKEALRNRERLLNEQRDSGNDPND